MVGGCRRGDGGLGGNVCRRHCLGTAGAQHLRGTHRVSLLPGDPLGRDPLPADAWANAVSAGTVPEDQRTEAQKSALELARTLAAELKEADAIVLAFPLYNYGVSQHVKIWMDLVLVENAGAEILKGKPVVLLTTRGGFYGAGAPREGWDHNTAYMRRILADAWGADLTVVEREFTLVGVNPALDDPSVVQNEDLVGVDDRRQAMRDGERRAIARNAPELGADEGHGACDAGGRGLSEQESGEGRDGDEGHQGHQAGVVLQVDAVDRGTGVGLNVRHECALGAQGRERCRASGSQPGGRIGAFAFGCAEQRGYRGPHRRDL